MTNLTLHRCRIERPVSPADPRHATTTAEPPTLKPSDLAFRSPGRTVQRAPSPSSWPVGGQKSASGCDLGIREQPGPRAWWSGVSIRLLYLILLRLAGWLILLGRSSASRTPRSSS